MTKSNIERFINAAALEEGPNCCEDWFKEISDYLRNAAEEEGGEDDDKAKDSHTKRMVGLFRW